MNEKLLKTLIIIATVSTLVACRKEKENKNDKLLLLGLVAAASTPYIAVTPTAGSITIASRSFTRTYNPKCSGVSGNQTFRFYLKKGSTKNLLVNFMGGGTCWDNKNCFGSNTTTYFDKMDSLSALAMRYVFGGILDEREATNPFKDYNVLFIPYCSGDLHWGSKEITYTDLTTNTATTLQHRGFDNFLSAIDYVKKNSDWAPESTSKIFVIGQSAGAYGAIFNFPYIKEIFSTNEVNVLGDAANGIVPMGFQSTSAITKWGADSNVPTWISGITAGTFSTIAMGDFYKNIAAAYPTSRVGQYSTNFDGAQRFFYDVQSRIQGGNTYYATALADSAYANTVDFWGKSDGTTTLDALTCDWVTQSRTQLITKASTSTNYRYYIAGGGAHIITTSKTFFTESSGGQGLIAWVNGMVAGNSDWVNRDCKTVGNCTPPATSTSPSGVSCSF